MKKIIFVCAILFLLSSCYDDKGNYEYSELNEITVDSVKSVRTVTQFKHLTMKPKVKQSVGKIADDLQYLWYVQLKNGKVDTLSLELNIDVPVNLFPDTYDACFVVTQRSTGAFFKTPFKLIVESELGQGVLVLSELSGYANLAYIQSDGTPVLDIYERMNGGMHLGEHPYKVCYMYKGNYSPAFITVMCQDGQGGCALNPIDFSRFKDYKDLFFHAPEKLNPQGYGYSNYYNYDESANSDLYYDFVINDGKVHERFTYVGWYQPPYSVDKDFEISGYTFMGMGQQIFYDNKHTQFLQRSSWPPNILVPVETPASYSKSFFDPVATGMKLVYADRGFSGTDYPNYYCVFKNETSGEFRFVKIRIAPSGFEPLQNQKITFPVTDATPFAVSFSTAALFYGQKNVLYCYDAGNEVSSSVYDKFEGKEEITALYLFPQYGADLANPAKMILSGIRLYVGVHVPGKERSGGVYEFKVNLNNTLTFVRRNQNICGEIVSMVWKF